MASITMQTNKRNNLLIINAKQIILEDEVLYNGHVIVESDGKIIEINKGIYYEYDDNNKFNACYNCKKNQATFAPDQCDECVNIYCKKCAMKMATGGRCKKCKNLFASMKRTSTEKKNVNRNNNKIINGVEYIIPGFIDIHNHGLGGAKDVLDYWTNPEFSLRKLYKVGVTSMFATLTFPDPPRLKRSLKACQVLSELYLKNNNYGARVEGIHCEGPIIQTRGGLPDSSIQKKWPIEKFNSFLDSIGPCLRIMTISPSADAGVVLDCQNVNNNNDDDDDIRCFTCANCVITTNKLNNDKDKKVKKSVSWSNNNDDSTASSSSSSSSSFEHIQSLIDRNIIVSLGHDKDCNEDQIFNILNIPLRDQNYNFHSTHVFNVQKFHHRNVGLANLAFLKKLPAFIAEKYNMHTYAKLPTIELIGDMMHLNPLLIQSVLDTHENGKHGNVCFITDAIADACPSMELTYGDVRKAFVDKEGKTVVDENGILCGSCATLYTTFLHLLQKFKLSIIDASRLLSGNPAKITRIYNKTGSIAKGKYGDLICLDNNFKILHVFVNGKEY